MTKPILFILLLTNILIAKSQNIVSDTVYINFLTDSILPVNYKIQSITDNRPDFPSFISYSQQKKFLIIPVDQEVHTKNAFSVELLESLSPTTQIKDTLSLHINYLNIEKYNGRLFNPYILSIDLPVYAYSIDTTKYIGTLSYNIEFKPKNRKIPISEISESMLSNWHRTLKLDLINTCNYIQNNGSAPENMITEKVKKPFYLNFLASGTVGIDFWQVEGELYLTRPETTNSRWFVANIIRYQNNEDFEMIGFGKKSEHYHKRLNNRCMLDVSSNILIGINKWKKPDDIKLQQIIQLSVSSSQGISYEKINSGGLILKTGVFENAYYIIEKKIKFQLGFYISTGYKF